MKDGYFRVATATPDVRVADIPYNLERTIEACRQAAQAGAGLLVLPELGLTGYTCSDLFLSKRLIEQAQAALSDLGEATATLDLVIVVGLPDRKSTRLNSSH